MSTINRLAALEQAARENRTRESDRAVRRAEQIRPVEYTLRPAVPVEQKYGAGAPWCAPRMYTQDALLGWCYACVGLGILVGMWIGGAP